MSIENYIKNLIKEKGYNLKSFARHIDIPNTTLYSALKENKFNGTSLNNVLKICAGLNISIYQLLNYGISTEHSMGEIIKVLREKSHLTQEELATITGYKSRSSINKIENGKSIPPTIKIQKLANALNISPEQITGWIGNINISDEEAQIIFAYKKANEKAKSLIKIILDINQEVT